MLPERVTVPDSGAVSPAMIRINVVFPAPLRPTRPIRSPSPRRIETPDISRRAPARTSRSAVEITARAYRRVRDPPAARSPWL